MIPDLCAYSALDLARAIRTGEASASEVVRAHISRIEAINHISNAVTRTLNDTALEAAADIDRRRTAGEPLPPLAGVPFSAKENIDVAGTPTTFGVRALKDLIANRDAPVVARLREAGAIPLARTNLPDLSLRFHTASQLYGETKNPWSAEHSPGGSSGGEAVAIATGMSPLGIGNDAGGSVRAPALFAGVMGLKPSLGRFPSDRCVGPRDPMLASQLFPVEGLLARCIRDLRAGLGLLSGSCVVDPRAAPVPASAPRPEKGRRRAAVLRAPGGARPHPHVTDALNRAAQALLAAGYDLEEADLPRINEAAEGFDRMTMTEFDVVWPQIEAMLPADGRRYLALSKAHRAPVSLREYLRWTSVRHSIQRDWLLFFEKYEVAVGPVYLGPALWLGEDIAGQSEHNAVRDALRLCVASTFVSAPAVCVPTGLSEGLPQGVQLISAPWREDLCLDAAEAIEIDTGVLTPIFPRIASAAS